MAQLPLRRPGPGAALPCRALVGVLGSRAWREPHWHTGDPNPGGGSEKGGAWWSHEKPLSVGTAFTSTGNSWSKPVMSLGPQLASLPSPCPLPVWLCPPWRPQVRSPDRPQASLSRTGKAASSQQPRGPPRSGTPVPDLHLLYAGLPVAPALRPLAFVQAIPIASLSSPESPQPLPPPLQGFAPSLLLSKAGPRPPSDQHLPREDTRPPSQASSPASFPPHRTLLITWHYFLCISAHPLTVCLPGQ